MTRVVVFAYHNVGVRCLKVLLSQGVDVALVLTHKDNPDENVWFSSVARTAADYGIETLTPENPNVPEVWERVAALQPDFIFSFYYRLMLQAPLLALARRGAYNMHGSLLPQYRGRAPVNWAVLHGERETGASLHRMVEKPDAGEIVGRQAVPVLPDDTASEVFDKVTLAAEMLLHRCLPDLVAGTAALEAPNLAAGSYFGGRKPEDGRIDWRMSAEAIHNLVRAVAPPYPGAFCDLPKGLGRLRILRSLHPTGERGPYPAPCLFARQNSLFAQCGDGRLLRLIGVEFAGRPLDASALATSFGISHLFLSP